MRLRPFAPLLAMLLAAWPAIAQTPTADQLSVLKNLPPDQQQQLLQSLGKGDGTGNKTDSNLQMPETVRQRNEQLDQYDRYLKDKTVDGRPLRLRDEDPELRPGDTVLIDLVTIVRRRRHVVQDSNTMTASAAGTSALNGRNTNSNNGNAGSSQKDTDEKTNENDQDRSYGRTPYEERPLSDVEKDKIEDFRQRILKNNPYKLNRYGDLEIPGLPSIPVAGLTAVEATSRLSADPDLRDFIVKVTLLRLKDEGEAALKPFGYDLFEGVPSTFAPVSDIQVPSDYIVGPGDKLEIQLYGNEPASYSLTVERDGRINFPKLGPISVGGLTFENARAAIEQRVSKQLIGGH